MISISSKNSTIDHAAKKEFRGDVEGIRAIGAVLVMVYHIWSQKVSGGVDVFFVVSSYLMTDTLLRTYDETGRLKPVQFLSRILSRVTPLAYLVVLVTLVGILSLSSPTFWRVQFNEAIMAIAHLENLQLARTGANYLDRDGTLSPFQQFWALSLQMQFYVALPFILMTAVFLWKRFSGQAAALGLVTVLGAISFVYAQIETGRDPSAAYFDPLARFWEFSVGISLAILHRGAFDLSDGIKGVMSWVGLAVLLTWGLLPLENASYPGAIALGPVMAAAMLILSGRNNYQGPVQRVLKHPYAVSFGGLSFSIYLWHWPLLVFSRLITEEAQSSFLDGLLIILGAIAIAILSKKLIEDPLRSVLRQRTMRPYAATAVLGAALLAPVFFIRGEIIDIQRGAPDTFKKFENAYYTGNQITLQSDASALSRQDFIAVGRDVPGTALAKCDPFGAGDKADPLFCTFGAMDSERTLVLVGGSRTAHWEPLLSEIGKRNGLAVVSATRSACAFGYLEGLSAACQQWNEKVIEQIIAMKPDFVVANATRVAGGVADQGKTVVEYVPLPYVEQIKKLLDANINVIGLRDTPRHAQHPVECLWRNLSTAERCSTPRPDTFDAGLSEGSPHLKDHDNFWFVDLSDLFCDTTQCPAFFDGRLMYRDGGHLTKSFMIYMSAMAETSLKAQVPRLFE